MRQRWTPRITRLSLALSFLTMTGGQASLAEERTTDVVVRFAEARSRDAVALWCGARDLIVRRPVGPSGRFWVLAVTDPAARARDVAALLDGLPGVAWAEPDRVVTLVPQYLPDDPLFVDGSQWYLHATGQTGWDRDADVDAPVAWDSWFGHPSTAVYVLDSGLDPLHPDLRTKIWINQGEIPATAGLVDADGDGVIEIEDLDHPVNAGRVPDRNGNGVADAHDLVGDGAALVGLENGIDDDGNGHVDDVVGIAWDGAAFDNEPYRADRICNDHGMGVAGVGHARSDDGIGLAGPCSECQVAGVPLLCSSEPASVHAEYFLHAGAMGFTATNNSYGPAGGAWMLPQVLADALELSATEGRGGRGVTHCFSAGNGHTLGESADDNGFLRSPHTVSVGAVAANADKAFYSEEGEVLDFCAPAAGAGINTITADLNGGWHEVIGATSEACGVASGSMALLSSAMPAVTPPKLRAVFAVTCKKVGPPGSYGPDGHGPRMGHGLISAGLALAEAAPAGQVLFDRLAYDCRGGSIVLSIRDEPGLGTRRARVVAPREPDGEEVTCMQVAGRPDLYEGTLTLTVAVPVPGDGELSVEDGDVIEAAHVILVGVDEVVVDRDEALADCGCAEPPTFAGLEGAIDWDPCLDDGVFLAWRDPDSWNGPPHWFHVYGAPLPVADPVADGMLLATLPASELAAWIELPAPNVPWAFAVIAEGAGEHCGGPTGGVPTATGPVLQAADVVTGLPAEPFPIHVRATPGAVRGVVDVSWPGLPGDEFTVHATALPLPLGGPLFQCAATDVAQPEWTDFTAARPGRAFVVTKAGECGESPLGADSRGDPRRGECP